MTPVFYIHLIATLVNMFFIVLLWWYNRKLIEINYQLISDSREMLNAEKRIQERINNIETINKYFDNKKENDGTKAGN